MPSEDSDKFVIGQSDHEGLVDQMSDTFAAWATTIDDIEDANLRSKMDSFLRSMIKHTVIMEQDLSWANMILGLAIEQHDIHPGTLTQAKGFMSAYDKKYVPLEVRDVA